jgi:hypothetical protein
METSPLRFLITLLCLNQLFSSRKTIQMVHFHITWIHSISSTPTFPLTRQALLSNLRLCFPLGLSHSPSRCLTSILYAFFISPCILHTLFVHFSDFMAPARKICTEVRIKNLTKRPVIVLSAELRKLWTRLLQAKCNYQRNYFYRLKLTWIIFKDPVRTAQ